ncbi:MAG: acriflavin resistance protein [marine bacterium B5-7]|nr:MAG: acriflavin resistance protein [marine bacterium B5-7]
MDRSPEGFTHRNDLVGLFTNHPVASNLLMIMMLLAGAYGLSGLNTQFFPTFDLDFASVRVVWTGASAEDVEDLITTPLEQELANVDDVKQMTSTSADGVSSISLEFDEGTDMGLAVDQVKEKVGLVRNLPASAETPEINRVVRYEPVGTVVLSGPDSVRELSELAHRFERELLDRGMTRVTIVGLPEEEIAIMVSPSASRRLGLSIADVGQRVEAASLDIPVGTAGRDDVARQLRFIDQRRTGLEFADVPIRVDASGQRVTLADIAEIKRRPRNGEVTLGYKGRPAVELALARAENGDSLRSATILDEWLTDTRPTLPPGIELHTYNENWKLLKGRIDLLLKNAVTGLLLVVAILFLFLSGRIAFWVTVGIPVSFMATLAILNLIGGSINMISLFGLIMALGIIVDDAIVVGEDAEAHFREGDAPLKAAEMGARRMLAPVMSSSLTTIAAFLPLLLVGGIIGSILSAIPVVIICVILASLVESFLVLPGHLRGALQHMQPGRESRVRRILNNGFNRFRDGLFRPLVTAAIEYRSITIACALFTILATAGWMAAGRMAFTFFPVAESTTVYANVAFVAGTPEARTRAFLQHLEDALWATEASFGESLVNTAIARYGTLVSAENRGSANGDQFASLFVELTEPDQRSVRNRDFIKAWKSRIDSVAAIENLTISERRGGPPGRDIDVRITGGDTSAVKAAAEEFKQLLATQVGVSGIEDDLPFGREQLVLSLTPLAESLGLTVREVSRQLRAAYDGYLVQILADGEDEVEVRVMLPDDERDHQAAFGDLEIILADGTAVPLDNVVSTTTRRGFDSIRHADGRLAVTVTADVDSAVANANDIVTNFRQGNMVDLSSRYGVNFSMQGRQADQQETVGDMQRGALLALALIYLVLAWVFGSYGWPLVVMAIIPFGLVGAFWGHVVMGLDLTILSLFGFFGLAGIVVNDSIILVVFYKHLREQGMPMREALVEASCRRLRAVLLTSLTTIGGLFPLLFETSLQAQFLIPMATSIAFGLGFSTLLVLVLVPSLLCYHEQLASHVSRRSRMHNATT